MLAGMEAIITPFGRRTDDVWVSEHINSLFAAIFFFIVMRVKAILTGEAVDREGYVPQRNEILALLSRARQEVQVRDAGDVDGWEAWESIKPRDFDAAVAHVNETDWLTGEWFTAITEIIQPKQQEDHASINDNEELTSQAQVKRADTMLQDKYDYLSEARRSDYKIWKDTMLTQISQRMASEGTMEIDVQ